MKQLPKFFARPLLWPRRFANQVILLTSLTIVTITVALTSYQIAEVSAFQYKNSQTMLSAIASNISSGISNDMIVKDYAEVEQVLKRAAVFPSIRAITVTNPAGQIISAVQHNENDAVTVSFEQSTLPIPQNKSPQLKWIFGSAEQPHPLALGLDATELILWHPIENGNLGWLRINISVKQIQNDALHIIEDSIIFALVGLLLLVIFLSYLLKPTLRALDQATNFARSLNNIRGQQIDVYNQSSEIEYLDHALNETSQRLHIQESAIKDSNALLTNVLAASSEISIIATNINGLISVFNSGAERLLGYTAEEIVNKQSPAPFHLPAEIQARSEELSAGLGYAVEGFRTFVEIAEKQGSEQREWTYVRKSGEHVPVSLVVTTMRNDIGEITGYLGIAQDITERKRIDQMKSEFVSTVSHELRTPLTAIAGALGLIAGGALGEMPDMAKQMIAIAHKNSQRLTFLINDLLDMEKLVAGKMQFDMKQQPLKPLIEQSLDGNRTYGTAHRVALALTSECPDVDVTVDSQRLLQVMSNLLSNAIKYSPEDGTVDISAHIQDIYVRVTVSDHGHGIPAEFLDRIFGKFSQADSSDTRQKGGTGLGLFITRELVERMGGKIGFNSIENQGASFYFDLPISGVRTTNSISSVYVHGVLAAKDNRPRILVVEDDADIAKLISFMLNRAGYSVDIALNGKQMLEALDQTSYVAMTLDLMLPDTSGLELLRRLRTRPDTADLPIVVVSAKMEEGRLAINEDFSDIDWLAKPIDEAALLSAVEKHLYGANMHHPHVLHVEDDADLHQVIRAMSGERFYFWHAASLHKARTLLGEEKFDLIILDISLPDGSGWQLLPEIRVQHPQARVIILSGINTTPDETLKVEAALLKSHLSAEELRFALNGNIRISRHE